MIVVAPGANRRLTPASVEVGEADAVMCQLEIPIAVVGGGRRPGTVLLPQRRAGAGRPSSQEPDLIVVNRYEYEVSRPRAGTGGADARRGGAVLLEGGEEIARATPPPIEAVDGTAAGDAFCAALVVGLVEGREGGGALAKGVRGRRARGSRPGAQPSLPTAAEVDALLAG